MPGPTFLFFDFFLNISMFIHIQYMNKQSVILSTFTIYTMSGFFADRSENYKGLTYMYIICKYTAYIVNGQGIRYYVVKLGIKEQ